jgi:tRNA-splicing ligase RtcB
MLEFSGKYNTARVFTNEVDEASAAQIIELCNQEFTKGSRIRMMPDVHAGVGCTVGTTMTITDKVVPNLVGVDIGCGMETILLSETRIDLSKLDELIYRRIPAGFSIRDKPHRYLEEIDLDQLYCYKHVNVRRAELSLGTLGGGNHFIEVERDDDGRLYLVIHSGSRHLGYEVARYYQQQGYKQCKHLGIPKSLAYVSGDLFRQYIHDMRIIQKFAVLNRKAIVDEILNGLGLHTEYSFTTIHNYIDTESMILRKGAVSAKSGERLLIPINMRDGSLICIGKGNEDWNYSAPHGAGRIMSRTQAKQSINLSDFKKQMEGIYTTSVSKRTLDEAPMAYKPMEDIIKNIRDTVEIEKIIRPVYNFKAGD